MIEHDTSAQTYRWTVLRRFLVLFATAAVLLGIIAATHYAVSMRSERIARETSELLNVELGKIAIGSALESVTSDLLFLARHNELQGVFDDAGQENRQALAEEFRIFIAEKGIYDQVRFLDDTGMEKVRVNYEASYPLIVPAEQLQSKAQRYYFQKIWTLDRGQVYLSPLDLNVEHGQIERPLKPMIRVGTPVFDRAGEKRGILLLNYYGEKLIRDFRRAAANISDHVMLLNSEGFWLSSPQREDEWGFMLGHDRSFAVRYPSAWERIRGNEVGQFRSGSDMYSFTTVYPLHYTNTNGRRSRDVDVRPIIGDSYYWKVVSRLSSDSLNITPGSFLRRHAPLYLAMLALLAIASLLLARAVVRHKQADAQLAFERRFREVLESVDLLAVGLDPEGRIVFCNDALLRLASRTREQTVGRDWFESFVPAGMREPSRQRFHQLLSRTVVPRRHEDEIWTQTGELRLIAWNDTLLSDADGRTIGLTFIGEDITEPRRREEQLRKLSRAVEQSPSTVIITDTNGKIEYANPKFTQLTGYELEEVRGQTPRILKSGETDSAEYKRLWETITAGGEWRGILHNKKKNGELYWEATCISPIRNAQGEVTHFIAVKEDITERLRLEQRFQRVVESAPNGIVMVDQQGKIVLVNFQTERLFGYRRDELIGQPVEMLVPKRFRSRHPERRNGFFREGQARAMGAGRELFGLRKDGTEFPVEIGLSPIETQEGKLVLGAIVDVTERKQLEKELAERNREIARTQALTAMGRMASMVAHDLRNPLSCIKMSLQMLGAQSSKDWQEAEHELKQIALEQVRYMEELMADLLVYSRPDALKPEWLNIDKVLDTAVILAQKHITEHEVRVKTFYQAGLPTVHGDADKLRRAFSNLIVNAAQATEGVAARKPQVTISTRLELGEDRPRVRVEVCDNGRGVEEGSEEMVFEPFFTTRAKGTGLGLAIVKRIVEQHQGSVRLQPAGTHGTCAIVILPTGPVAGVGESADRVEAASEPAASLIS